MKLLARAQRDTQRNGRPNRQSNREINVNFRFFSLQKNLPKFAKEVSKLKIFPSSSTLFSRKVWIDLVKFTFFSSCADIKVQPYQYSAVESAGTSAIFSFPRGATLLLHFIAGRPYNLYEARISCARLNR